MPKQGFTKVAGQWRRNFRADDMLLNTIMSSMGAYQAFGEQFYGFSSWNYGAVGNPAAWGGFTLMLLQTGLSSSYNGYGPRRWIQIGFKGNIVGQLDAPWLIYGGIRSAAQIVAPNYVSVYDITELKFGFNQDVPISGNPSILM